MTLGYEKAAHLYDLFDRKENIDFFYQGVKNFNEILDIGAGTGRIAIPLSKNGIKVICIEPSPAMRDEFLKKIVNDPNLAKLIKIIPANAANFRLNKKYPAAILSGCFDHFLSDEERLASLTNINSHLKIGGKIIFDVFIGLMKDSPLSSAGIVSIGEDLEYHRFVSTEIQSKKIKITLIYKAYKKGKLIQTIKEDSSAGIINRIKLHELLNQTGFKIINEFSGYNFSTFKNNDPLLIVEAEKVENSS
ncbi:MAG: class I SAM-dependent methyltransferase [Candidatus Hodarchaeota archaeon]